MKEVRWILDKGSSIDIHMDIYRSKISLCWFNNAVIIFLQETVRDAPHNAWPSTKTTGKRSAQAMVFNNIQPPLTPAEYKLLAIISMHLFTEGFCTDYSSLIRTQFSIKMAMYNVYIRAIKQLTI